MDLYPAIDILGGRCVRLHQGAYDRETVYSADPVAQAIDFARRGAPWLHVVDLDAARLGSPVNRAIVEEIVSVAGVPVQVGGGIRSVDTASSLIEAGAARLVIGTAAVLDPDLVEDVAGFAPVAIGLDARDRRLAVDGWERDSGVDLLAAVARFARIGVDAFVVTEIGRDGTMTGPDLDGLAAVLAATDVSVIASGGVGSDDDIAALAGLEASGRRLAGVIVGRAIYEGAVTVESAMAACQRAVPGA